MEPFARTIDAAKKYVVSSTLDRVDWNAELVRGDLGKAVQQLKREPGKGLLAGGVKLPLALAELGLIDEYEFVVHPRLAGHGPTLFAGLSKHVDLKLVSRLEFGSGAVAMRYEPIWRRYCQARVGSGPTSKTVGLTRGSTGRASVRRLCLPFACRIARPPTPETTPHTPGSSERDGRPSVATGGLPVCRPASTPPLMGSCGYAGRCGHPESLIRRAHSPHVNANEL